MFATPFKICSRTIRLQARASSPCGPHGQDGHATFGNLTVKSLRDAGDGAAFPQAEGGGTVLISSQAALRAAATIRPAAISAQAPARPIRVATQKLGVPI